MGPPPQLFSYIYFYVWYMISIYRNNTSDFVNFRDSILYLLLENL